VYKNFFFFSSIHALKVVATSSFDHLSLILYFPHNNLLIDEFPTYDVDL